MLYSLVIGIHVIACLVLIGVILLQAGRGGGLSEAFGGDSTRTIFGAKTSVFLTKATVVAAVLFLITCMVLGIMTSRRGRSLIGTQKKRPVPITMPQTLPMGEQEKAPGNKRGTPLAEPEKLPAK